MKPIFLLLIFLPFFLLRYNSSQPKFLVGQKLKITAHIYQEPRVYNNKQSFNASNIWITVPRFPEYHYGDLLEITGTIAKNERGYQLENPEAKLLEKHGFLPDLRLKLMSLIQKTLPQREAALVSGIAFGAKEDLAPNFRDSLIASGTIHVVVASGSNITLLARFLTETSVIFLRRRIALVAAFLGIWVYIFLIGPEAPIVRAGIMGSLTFLAQQTGRIYLSLWSLVLTAGFMLLVNPLWVSDLGFLLSFAATLSILIFEKPILTFVSEKFRYIPSLFRDHFSTSLAAQAGVLPIIWFSFGQFSPWSPLTNGLLLWVVSPIMVIGFIGGLFGLIYEQLGQVILLLSYPLALFFSTIVSIF